MSRADYVNGNMIKPYIELTKTGIIWGNCIAMTGGFMLASAGKPEPLLYILTLLGVALIIASGCVFNNVIDSDIDGLMARTSQRALVVGQVSKRNALIYASLLGIVGFYVLYFHINTVAFLVGFFGFYFYVTMYSLLHKRRSVHGTLVGSVSGATPPVMGYVAVTGHIDLASLLIFFGFCAWQMPHSYAIALFRQQDYQASSIPLLPIVKGLKSAQRQMLVYTLLFLLSIILLYVYSYISVVTVIIMSIVCGYWIYQTIALFKPDEDDFDPQNWGKRLFITSIIAITAFSVILCIDFLFI